MLNPFAAFRRRQALRRLAAQRQIVLDAFRATLERGDTRAQSLAQRPAILATCAAIAAETGIAPKFPLSALVAQLSALSNARAPGKVSQ